MFKTLRGRISFIYLCLVIMLAIVGTTSVVNLYKLGRAIDGLMTNNYQSINAVNNMLDALERQDSAVLIYISGNRIEGINLFSSSNKMFSKWYNIEYNNVTESGERDHVDKINEYYIRYLKLFSNMQEISNNQGNQDTISFYSTNFIPNLDRLKQELKSLSALNEKAMLDSKNSAMKNTQSAMYIILILSSLAVIGGFLTSRFFTNKFLKPIYSLTETIRSVKAGNLSPQSSIIPPNKESSDEAGTQSDEVGQLAYEFYNMTKRLQQFEQSTLGTLMSEKNKSLAIVKSISDPLIVLDIGYRIILLNDACESFFKINEGKVLNKHFIEVIKNNELFNHISSVFESKQVEYREKIIYIQSDEKDYYFNAVVTNIKGSEAKVTGLVILLQNVTQLKHLERIKTDFISTISHEFKTPLTSIIMGTSLMVEEDIGKLNEKQRRIMLTITEDGERLSALVNNLLELSRIESEKSVFKIKTCSIAGIIENSVKPLYEQGESRDINLYFEADEKLPKVNADYERITWVINNLVTNALKYTNAGDEISIIAFVEQGKMCVSVRDTGMGIPEEYTEKIFDRFVQVKGYDLEVRGTGLGLAIVKEIVEAHGGEIWCESKLDVGSTFTFTLPLSRA